MAVVVTAEDRAEALEARCRKAMAQISTKPRGWSSARVRAEELAYVDRLLDEWLDLTRP